MSKHIAIYHRGESIRTRGASPLADLKTWAEAQQTQVTWYRDPPTGATRDRPGWTRLMKGVHAGAVQTIVVWRINQIGMTTKGLAALVEDLDAHQVNLVSLEDGLDLATASGRRMVRFLTAVALYDHQARAARVRAGQAAARGRGVRFGHPVGTGTRIKVTREQEARVCRLKAEGKTITAIARRCGLSRPTVYNILGREYAGPPNLCQKDRLTVRR